MEISQPPPPVEAVPARPARLFNRNFLLLWQGQAVSRLGSQAFAVAMMFWVMEKTGSASLMGFLMTFSMLPGVLLGPIGGTFADRHSRVKIIVVCDIISGLGVLLLAFAMMSLPDAVDILIPLLFVVAVLGGVVQAFFMPAIAASVPDLVAPERLAAANSLNQFSNQAALLIGQAAGGVLYNTLGAPLLFLIDGLSYLFSGVSEMFIRLPARPRPQEERTQSVFRTYVQQTAEGFRYVWQRTGLRSFIFAISFLNFLVMPIMVLFPFYVSLYLRQGSEWYGFLMAGMSAGAVAGFVLAGVLKLQGAGRARGLLICMLLMPVFIGILGFVRVPVLALALVFLDGAAMGLINVYLVTMIQRSTPSEIRGRVMGLLGTLSGGLMPIGMALGGVVGDLTGKNVPLIYAVCAGTSVLLVLVFWTLRDFRDFLTNA
ncbi:MAG TPA: MFS transporter [Thermoanaerobaculia bacterium]|nr:MFS transporter [Thermoanaerobaculia bacterium]